MFPEIGVADLLVATASVGKMMAQNREIAVSHVGLCTADLERSVRFYTEALGFALEHYADVGEPFDVLAELPAIRGRAGFFLQDGLRLELLGYQNPAVVGPSERRPMNQLGLTHLSLLVDDLDTVVERIERLGGRSLPHTRLSLPTGDMIFCTDPDGVRIELRQRVKNLQQA
jgi:catechol 2,3-dioxygenase-like lactoylglutathione lyase family enzyme